MPANPGEDQLLQLLEDVLVLAHGAHKSDRTGTGTLTLQLYPDLFRRALPAVARGGVHAGASGLVYGLVSYIFVAGLIRRDKRAIAGALLVSFMYGALVWGILPIKPEVSWETHLAATLIGVLLAFGLRRLDVRPCVR